MATKATTTSTFALSSPSLYYDLNKGKLHHPDTLIRRPLKDGLIERSIPAIFLFLRNRGPNRDTPQNHYDANQAVNLIHFAHRPFNGTFQSNICLCLSTPGSLSAGSPGTRPLVIAGFAQEMYVDFWIHLNRFPGPAPCTPLFRRHARPDKTSIR